ncbi:chromosome partitioning protein ParB [Aneurinibacillus migulanus]|uniref:Chromosome partitioning protein ParB n=1 Tax=Aneurinibacillus migulanus TaxID=47500 RepID=A0A0D1XAF7_ANEMI|nr:nucleoid occlusion protein [Aneurinibacillus migulanus]KIV51187.1 chromosome partitioning protein ParB [Aneurinibacillus migulanus]KIV51381.1 chromosome partitioning protein ParB [Aneurinibacillus migulanus]KON93275.1 chromosome partitioning protein ParB [Aneurinibacillus migulanus]KPD10167.1 chromosome partitioning protein ParB [Aneurinibacillus migulanus]MCP1356694.1 nucleoid occlusion protein [Aneurinibacillus migulanus]
MKDQFSRLFGLTERTDQEEIRNIPVARIVPNPYQPRTVFDDDKIDELCETIKVHGVIQPIVVRERGGAFEIIAGERRWRAVTRLGMEKIPAIIKDFNNEQAASIALIENLQREGLTPIEEAIAYQKLIDIHGLTQESLASRLGKGQSTIANKLRLLHLPEPVQEALLGRKISERHARALLVLKDEELQLKVLHEVVEKGWNVKQTEQRIKLLMEAQNQKPGKQRRSFSKDMRLAINTVRQSVDMVLQSGLNIQTEEEDHEEFYQFVIKIPKEKK